jgi:hypothetical protein
MRKRTCRNGHHRCQTQGLNDHLGFHLTTPFQLAFRAAGIRIDSNQQRTIAL